jgi:adenosylmethionine-8-amino-7-oxononanoate aminotransferase
VGRKIGHHAIEHDVLLHSLGDVLDLMPHDCIVEPELAWVYEQLDRVLTQMLIDR